MIPIDPAPLSQCVYKICYRKTNFIVNCKIVGDRTLMVNGKILLKGKAHTIKNNLYVYFNKRLENATGVDGKSFTILLDSTIF